MKNFVAGSGGECASYLSEMIAKNLDGEMNRFKVSLNSASLFYDLNNPPAKLTRPSEEEAEPLTPESSKSNQLITRPRFVINFKSRKPNDGSVINVSGNVILPTTLPANIDRRKKQHKNLISMMANMKLGIA